MRLRRAVVLFVLAFCACKRGGPSRPDAAPLRPLLGEVVAADVTEAHPPPAKLDVGMLSTALRSKALATGLFETGGGDAAAGRAFARLHLEVAMELAEVKDKGAARVAVHLRIDTRPGDAPGAIDEDVTAAAEEIFSKTGPVNRAALFPPLVDRAVSDLLGAVAARLRLRAAPASELRAVLRADGGELREEAIRVIGERKLRDEVPALLELLNDSDESLRDASLGALIEMKEARAVPVLTKTRSFRDKREMRKILDAVSTLGGTEALDYLTFVVETHDDPEIRQIAADAKARLERRTAPAR